MSCPFHRFRQLIEQDGHAQPHIDATEIVRTAADANFLMMQGDQVRPCIPLLARIAHPLRPAILP